jgi:hypothetical protein
MIGRASSPLRTNARTIVIEVLVNGVLPFVAYDLVKPKYGDVNGLLASMLPPVVWSIVEFVRRRRIDAVSIFIIAGIALSLLAFFGGGSARFLQLRENLVSAVIGLVFLVSAALRKPLMYELARASMKRTSPAQVANFERLKDNPGFRRSMTRMTVVWGFGLLVQTGIACVLVFTLPIATYLIVSPIVGYGVIGLLALWTFSYVARLKRQRSEHP